MEEFDVERRRAQTRERVRRHRAARAEMKKNGLLPRLNRAMEVMAIERRRALTRERVRRHRATHAQSKETTFLPRFNGGIQGLAVESDTQRRETMIVDDLRKVSGTNTSKFKSTVRGDRAMHASNDSIELEIQNEDEEQHAGLEYESTVQGDEVICTSNDNIKLEIKNEDEEVQGGVGFDFEEFDLNLKASPASSVASNASWKSYRLPISAMVSSHVEPIQSASTSGTQELTAQNIPIPTDSNVLHILFEAIQKLSAEQSQLTAAVNRMGDMLECLTSEVLHRKREPFEKKYNLQIPFATREDFMRFDEQLASDELCRAALTHSLVQKYDAKKSITKNITSILRKYMTRGVALLYTAQKAVGGRGLFKDTAFSACLLDTIVTLAEDKIIAPVADNEYLGSLGSVLSNAKDWGVARHERRTKKQRTDE